MFSGLRLYDTGGLAVGRYLTLSHRWGHGCEKFSTTQDNVDQRKVGLDISELPKGIQDAIQVARNLEVQFIWIDSLCIVQDDDSDWARESVCMEDIYASSYCTIAVTSLDDLRGFLVRNNLYFNYRDDNSDAGDNKFKIGSDEADAEGSVYIYASTVKPNFVKEVDEAELNQRG
jgi:hypothetical protein